MAEAEVVEQELRATGKGGQEKEEKHGESEEEGNQGNRAGHKKIISDLLGTEETIPAGEIVPENGTTGGGWEGEEGENMEEEGEDVQEEEEEEKPFHFDGEHEYEGVIYPASVPRDVLDRIKDFEFRPDDIVVAGYPKCGTTWIEHITYLLLYSDQTDPLSHSVHDLTQHSGFLEARVPGGYVTQFLDVAEELPKPRLIRTHLPYALLSEQLAKVNPKILVAMRNPKDCLVSYYHFLKNNEDIFGFYGDFDKFFEQLVKEKRLTFGDWFDHVTDWWRLHHEHHVIFLEFEDMVGDLRREVQNIVDFLEIDVEDERLDEVTKLSHFKEMLRNPMTQLRIFPFLDADIQRFMRKGTVGDWKEHFNEEQNKYIDDIYNERIRGTGIELTFEIK